MIDVDGKLVDWFASTTSPKSNNRLRNTIEKALKEVLTYAEASINTPFMVRYLLQNILRKYWEHGNAILIVFSASLAGKSVFSFADYSQHHY